MVDADARPRDTASYHGDPTLGVYARDDLGDVLWSAAVASGLTHRRRPAALKRRRLKPLDRDGDAKCGAGGWDEYGDGDGDAVGWVECTGGGA